MFEIHVHGTHAHEMKTYTWWNPCLLQNLHTHSYTCQKNHVHKRNNDVIDGMASMCIICISCPHDPMHINVVILRNRMQNWCKNSAIYYTCKPTGYDPCSYDTYMLWSTCIWCIHAAIHWLHTKMWQIHVHVYRSCSWGAFDVYIHWGMALSLSRVITLKMHTHIYTRKTDDHHRSDDHQSTSGASMRW